MRPDSLALVLVFQLTALLGPGCAIRSEVDLPPRPRVPTDSGVDRPQVDVAFADILQPDTGTMDIHATAPDAGSDAGMVDAGSDASIFSADCPAADDLLVCLLFEGNLLDSSSPAYTVTSTTGASPTFEVGVDSQAIGMRQGLRLVLQNEDEFHAPPATIEGWFNVVNWPEAGERAVFADKEGLGAIVILPGGVIRGSGLAAAPILSARGVVTRTVWHHVALTRSSDGETVLYLDSGIVGRSMDSRSRDSLRGWYLGNNDNAGGGNEDPLLGLMDRVRIWSRALTHDEVRAAHNFF